MDWGTYRTFTQYWTGEPIKPIQVLDWGNYRTFPQCWTGESMEPFPSIGHGKTQNLFPGLEPRTVSSTELGNLEPIPSIGLGNL